MKRIVIFALAACLVLGVAAPQAFSQDEGKRNFNGTGKGEAMLFDLLFLRPFGIASCVVGFVGTIVSLPFTIGRNDMREVTGALLTEPGDYTFERPLGDID